MRGTPAVAAGITDRLCTMEELVTYPIIKQRRRGSLSEFGESQILL